MKTIMEQDEIWNLLALEKSQKNWNAFRSILTALSTKYGLMPVRNGRAYLYEIKELIIAAYEYRKAHLTQDEQNRALKKRGRRFAGSALDFVSDRMILRLEEYIMYSDLKGVGQFVEPKNLENIERYLRMGTTEIWIENEPLKLKLFKISNGVLYEFIVSGARVTVRKDKQIVCQYDFETYGAATRWGKSRFEAALKN